MFNISKLHKMVVVRTTAEQKQVKKKWLWGLLMNILTRTVNTLSEQWILSMNQLVYSSLGLSSSRVHPRLPSVILSIFAVSC